MVAFPAVAEAASTATDPAARVEAVEATQPVAVVVLPAVEVVLKPPTHERDERQRFNFFKPPHRESDSSSGVFTIMKNNWGVY